MAIWYPSSHDAIIVGLSQFRCVSYSVTDYVIQSAVIQWRNRNRERECATKMSTYYGDAQFPVTRCDDICPFRSSLWTGNWLRAIKRSLWRNTRRQLKDLQSSRDAANRVLSSTVALLEFERWTDFTQWAVGRHLMSHRFRNGVFQWRSVAKTHVYSNSLKLEIFGRSICWKVDERKKNKLTAM